jgi:hypothetical protein
MLAKQVFNKSYILVMILILYVIYPSNLLKPRMFKPFITLMLKWSASWIQSPLYLHVTEWSNPLSKIFCQWLSIWSGLYGFTLIRLLWTLKTSSNWAARSVKDSHIRSRKTMSWDIPLITQVLLAAKSENPLGPLMCLFSFYGN